MTEESSAGSIVVRKSTDLDIAAIEELLCSVDTRCSLHRQVHLEVDLHATPTGIAPSWQHEWSWVAERHGVLVGHFIIWNVNERQQYIYFVCALSSTLSDREAIQAVDLFLDIMFRQHRLHKVCLLVRPETPLYSTLAQQLSLLLEGTLRDHFSVDGEWYDVAIFSQTASEREPAIARRLHPEAHRDEQYEWLMKQARYDNIQVCIVRAIILRMGKEGIRLLLLKKSNQSAFPGIEEVPGNKLLEGESLFQALERSVKAQTGLSIAKNIHYLTAFDFTTDAGQRMREFVFRVKPSTWDVVINPKEHQSFNWLLLQDVPSSRLHPDLIQILSSYSPTLSYETEGVPIHEHEAAIELVRPPSPQLEETLLVGHHLDAYAAKGLPMIETFGLVLRDSANRIVGGMSAEMAYGSLFIRRLWVDPNWRRAGWGKKLIARAESLARERGMEFVTGLVMDWEFISFFQKLGYTIDSQHTGYQNASRQFRLRKSLIA
jgi:GNAT superfamily N-acetyltransferase/ADP-ribose pyrophosphatase YjhB (NUDIX family)